MHVTFACYTTHVHYLDLCHYNASIPMDIIPLAGTNYG